MSKIPKLLWCGDVNMATGFGKVTDNVLTRLKAGGDYEIVAMGINNRGLKNNYGFQVYSCDSSDPYGFQLLPIIMQQEKPDVVFIIQDLFAAFQYTHFIREYYPNTAIVLYFPIDGNSTPPHWLQTIREATVPIPYSDYALSIIEDKLPDLKNKFRVIYHGVDATKYTPFPTEERERIRAGNKMADKFVVGIVNRFQPRKLIPMGVRAWSLFRNGYKKCKCGNYYLRSLKKCDLNFCPESDVVEVCEGHEDTILYLHMNPFEQLMGGPNCTLEMSLDAAGISKEQILKDVMIPGVDVLNPATSPTETDMIVMYNFIDVYVATDCGEGYGLTQMEALSCGAPVIKSLNTTAPELLGEFGHYAKSGAFFSMGFDSGHYRPVVSIPSVIDHLEALYVSWVGTGRKTLPNRRQNAYVMEKFNWNDKVREFDKAIKDALAMHNATRNESSELVVAKA